MNDEEKAIYLMAVQTSLPPIAHHLVNRAITKKSTPDEIMLLMPGIAIMASIVGKELVQAYREFNEGEAK